MTIKSVTQNPANEIKHPNWKPGSKDGIPEHVTAAGTCKYQCNGPVTWGPKFRQVAEKIGGKGAFVGMGIRAALAFVMEDPATFERLMGKISKDSPQRAIDLAPKAKAKPVAKPAPKAKPAKAPKAKPAKAAAAEPAK